MHSKKEGKKRMKTTGITRRIDELGRIVIPKEIRKNMHIKSGELMEIYLQDENTIVLKKYSLINQDNNVIRDFIKYISIKTNSNIFITDLDKVVFSNIANQVNKKLYDSINGIIQKKSDKFQITEDYFLEKTFSFYNICPNGDLAGYVFFDYKNDKNNKELENIAVDFIENYLENE